MEIPHVNKALELDSIVDQLNNRLDQISNLFDELDNSKENGETNVALSSRISRHVLPFVRFSGVVTASRAKSSSLFEDADDGKLKYKNKDNIVTELT